jgi:hypothetical protein
LAAFSSYVLALAKNSNEKFARLTLMMKLTANIFGHYFYFAFGEHWQVLAESLVSRSFLKNFKI